MVVVELKVAENDAGDELCGCRSLGEDELVAVVVFEARGQLLRGLCGAVRSVDKVACVGVLGTGVPRLACLRPAAWLKEWPSMARLHQPKLKTLARGQALRGARRKASSRAASPGWIMRRQRDQGKEYLTWCS